MPDKHILYAAEFSLYSGKARSYLHYNRIPFDEVLSSIKIYRDTIIPQTGVRFIPVVRTPDGEYLQDTSHIIDTLEKAFPGVSLRGHRNGRCSVDPLGSVLRQYRRKMWSGRKDAACGVRCTVAA